MAKLPSPHCYSESVASFSGHKQKQLKEWALLAYYGMLAASGDGKELFQNVHHVGGLTITIDSNPEVYGLKLTFQTSRRLIMNAHRDTREQNPPYRKIGILIFEKHGCFRSASLLNSGRSYGVHKRYLLFVM